MADAQGHMTWFPFWGTVHAWSCMSDTPYTHTPVNNTSRFKPAPRAECTDVTTLKMQTEMRKKGGKNLADVQ